MLHYPITMFPLQRAVTRYKASIPFFFFLFRRGMIPVFPAEIRFASPKNRARTAPPTGTSGSTLLLTKKKKKKERKEASEAKERGEEKKKRKERNSGTYRPRSETGKSGQLRDEDPWKPPIRLSSTNSDSAARPLYNDTHGRGAGTHAQIRVCSERDRQGLFCSRSTPKTMRLGCKRGSAYANEVPAAVLKKYPAHRTV